jgi:preprotein translocase subunit SecF
MSAFGNRQFDFMGKAPIAIVFSLLLAAFSIYQWVSLGDEKYGIDFKGGSELIVRFSAPIEADAVKAALSSVNEVSVQAFEDQDSEYSIRIPVAAGAEKAGVESIRQGLNAKFAGGYEELATNTVGPVIGSELKRKATLAFALGLLVLLVYITFRFEFAFALGAVAAVFHDVIVCIGIYLAFGNTVTMGALAAALTIIGYSVNDTIVVFDRMREEMGRRKDFDVIKLMNECINLTLSRTIITSLLTFFSAMSLFLLGGGAIKDLSFFLVVGLISGTYSTIYIASPVAYWWDKFRNPIKGDVALDSAAK